MPRYCIVTTIIAGESGAAVRTLFGLPAGGNTGLKDYVKGLDADEGGVFSRWVLAFNDVPPVFEVNHGIDVLYDAVALIVFNENVSATLKTRIGELATARPTLVHQLMLNPALTRAQMSTRLAVEVGKNRACSHYWHTKPGDDVVTGITDAASLLAKFQAVPV